MQKPIAFVLLIALSILMASCGSLNTAKPVEKEKAREEQPKVSKVVHVKIDGQMIAKATSYSEIMRPVLGDIYGSHDQYMGSLSRFSRSQRLLFAIDWYLDEVNNGGHKQFFLNPTGIVCEDALAGFKEFGFPKFEIVLKESAERMGGKPSFDRDAREKHFRKMSPDFKDLDGRLYELEENYDAEQIEFTRKHSKEQDFEVKLAEFKRTHIPKISIAVKLLEYVQAHPKEFLFEGDVESE